MRTSQTIRNAGLAGGSRALHGAPEDGPHPSAGGGKRRKANKNARMQPRAASIVPSRRQPTDRRAPVWGGLLCAEQWAYLYRPATGQACRKHAGRTAEMGVGTQAELT